MGSGIQMRAPAVLPSSAIPRGQQSLAELTRCKRSSGRTCAMHRGPEKQGTGRHLGTLSPPPKGEFAASIRTPVFTAAFVRDPADAPASRPGMVYVIEGPGGEQLPCSWVNAGGMACPSPMRFSDSESAQGFLAIFARLGHDYPGFTIQERRLARPAERRKP